MTKVILNKRSLTSYVAIVLATTIALALLAAPGNAQRSEQRVIASGSATTKSSQLVIDAKRSRGAFREIRLINTSGARIVFRSLRVIYSDGTSDSLNRRFSLRSGERTRPLNKNNALKFVDQVIADLIPNRRGRQTSAQFELQGSQTYQESRLSRADGNAREALDAADSDVLFGYRNVSLDVDRDEIKLGRKVGRFSHLKFNVFENDVFIRDVRIDYLDGTSQFVPVQATIKNGSSSNWVKVNSDQFIDKIVLIYRTERGNSRSARVEVTGEYAKNWLARSGDGRKFNDGWVMLGAETAGAIGYDTDTIKVGRNEGGFKELRLNIRGRSITLRDIRVYYGDGQSDNFKIRKRVDPGQTVGPLRLTKGDAPIRRITAKYRTRLFFGKGKGTAMVEVWARY